MIAQDRLCLECLKREILGKPWTVYLCRECYTANLRKALDNDGTSGTATLTEKDLRDCFERENGYPLDNDGDDHGR